jgi:hypothetical protein
MLCGGFRATSGLLAGGGPGTVIVTHGILVRSMGINKPGADEAKRRDHNHPEKA